MYNRIDDYENAIKSFKKFQELTGHPTKGLTGLSYTYAKYGKKEELHDCLAKLEKRKELEPQVMLHMDYVVIYTGLKEYDKAFYHLEEALKQKSGVYFVKTATRFNEMHEDPRYSALMDKYGY